LIISLVPGEYFFVMDFIEEAARKYDETIVLKTKHGMIRISFSFCCWQNTADTKICMVAVITVL